MLETVCENYTLSEKAPHVTGSILHTIDQICQSYRGKVANEGYIDTGVALQYLGTHFPELAYDMALYGFSDLTRAQQSMFAEVASRVAVHVFGFGAQGSPPFESMRNVAQTISPEGERVLELEGDIVETSSNSHLSDLAVLAHQAYGKRLHEMARDDTVSMQVVYGSAAQIISVATQVEALHKKPSTNRVAVVLSNLRESVPALEREMRARGIPYAFDIEVPLTGTEFGNAFSALLDLAGASLSADMVMNYTGSLFSDYSFEEAVHYDTKARTGGFGGMAQEISLNRALSWFLANTESPSVTLSLLRKYMNGASFSKWRDILNHLLAQGVERGFSGPYQQASTLASYRTILMALEEVAKLKGEKVSSRDIRAALQGISVQLNPAPGSRDVVFTTLQRMDGLIYDAVIVAGIDSKTHSTSTSLSNAEQILNQMGIGQYDSESDEEIERSLAHRNKYYEASLFQSPQKYLSIIFQRTNDDGQKLQPSGFLEEIVSQFQASGQSFDDVISEFETDDCFAWESKEVECAVMQSGEEAVVDNAPQPERGAQVALDEALAETVSVSAIELYAQCPYRWFIKYVMGIEEFDRDLDKRDIGGLTHDILHAFFEQWKELRDEPITQHNLPEALKLAERVIVKAEKDSILWDMEPEEFLRVREYVQTSLESEPNLNILMDNLVKPHAFELDIQAEDNIVIGGARISGRIDRVDVSSTHFAVIDYKGTVGSSASLIENLNLQVGIYLLALKQLSKSEKGAGLTGKEPAAGIYMSYKTGKEAYIADKSVFSMKTKGDDIKPDEHERFLAQLDEVETIVKRAVDGMRAGHISPPDNKPKNAFVCASCPHLRCDKRQQVFR